jgi:hypothetical protein
MERLKRNLNSRDKWIRYLSGRTLGALEGAGNHVKETPATVALSDGDQNAASASSCS